MKRYAILISVLCLIFFVQIVVAEQDVSGIWKVLAQGESVGCTVNTPGGIGTCGYFQISSPDISVTQSGTTLSASAVDGNGNPLNLNGAINGKTVTFTIHGTGFTPGIGPATTTYTGTLNKNVIVGTFLGSASWTYDDGSGNILTETATWTGTFGTVLNQYKVDVRAKRLEPNILKNFYHTYIIYRDSSGKEWYYRGGAENIYPPWGKIVTEFGPYAEDTVDWSTNAKSVTVLTGDAAKDKNICFSNQLDIIAAKKVGYSPLGPNCNTVAYTLLIYCGISPVNPISNNVQIPGWGQMVELFFYVR